MNDIDDKKFGATGIKVATNPTFILNYRRRTTILGQKTKASIAETQACVEIQAITRKYSIRTVTRDLTKKVNEYGVMRYLQRENILQLQKKTVRFYLETHRDTRSKKVTRTKFHSRIVFVLHRFRVHTPRRFPRKWLFHQYQNPGGGHIHSSSQSAVTDYQQLMRRVVHVS